MSERDTTRLGGNGKSIRIEHASLGITSVVGLVLVVGGYFAKGSLEELARLTRAVTVLEVKVEQLESDVRELAHRKESGR
jgi:hypothetical protein